MGAAGWHGEYRRDRQKIGAGLRQSAVEVWKAHIVTNGHAEASPRCIGHNSPIAGPVGVAFAIALAAREVDIEHVDLVVTPDDRTAWIEEKRAVGESRLTRSCTGLAARVDHQRADQKPRPGLLRDGAHAGEEGIVGLAARLFAAALAALDKVRRLGRHDQISAAVARPADQVGYAR